MPTAPAVIVYFPKICCGRPTQTRAGKPYCPKCGGPKSED